MSHTAVHYRRNLPHIHPAGYPLFITFRLAGSLPLDILAELKSQRDSELKSMQNDTAHDKYQIEKKYFGRYDDLLDHYADGPRWLEMENVAQVVAKEMQEMNGDRFKLVAYCIMPNHVHLLIEALVSEQASHDGKSGKYPVTDSLRLLKGRTARECNLQLKRNGSFWQHESYDHYVRDDEELERIILYIFNNPVKAGLVNEWKEWSFAYVAPEFGQW